MSGPYVIRGSVSLPEAELMWRFSRSSGPGGQHVNTSDSQVELRFDLAGTGAIYNTHPLQRCLRDALVPAQHAMLQTNTIEAAGAVLLGADITIPSFP